jgi:type VI secretion system secreted protein VgrG
MLMGLPNIKIGDDLLQDALLASVEIVQELNQHWWCTIVCRQTEDNPISVENLLGQTIEVKTTDESGVEYIQFSGFFYDVRLVYEVWGSYTAHLVAVSTSYNFDITARKQYYAEQTLSSIASTIGGRDGLSVSVNTDGSKALNYVQYGETDFSFLNRIVDDYGAWLRPTEGGVEIFSTFQTGSSLSWREENGLVEFSLRGTLAPASFSGSHYDHHVMQSNTFNKVSKAPQFYDGAQQLTGAVLSASQKLPTGFEPQRARAMTLDNYNEQLEAESERSMGGAVTGSGQSRSQTLMAGNTVSIDGTLAAKGTYGLVKVVHNWTPQGYINHFICTPWKNYRNPQPPVTRVWNGLVSARVIDHNDPKKMGRIKVQFFWQEDGSTHWARTTSPHAGPDRGLMFMPEIGDEVAVAFEDGDPERLVIIGAMWNGVHTQPREPFFGEELPGNDIKRLMTKSGNRIQFIDKVGKESLVLATPNKLRISMIENTDEHGRSTILLHSEDGDICLSAPNGQVHIRSKFFTKETN